MTILLHIITWLIIGSACIVLGAVIVPLLARTILFIIALVEWMINKFYRRQKHETHFL